MSTTPTGIDLLLSKEQIRDVIYQWSRGVARKRLGPGPIVLHRRCGR